MNNFVQQRRSVERPCWVIAAMLADDKIMRLSGEAFITAEAAQFCNVTHIDGLVILSLRAERGSPIW